MESKHKIPIHIMYPAGFPKKAPFVRIVNPSPNLLTPHGNFKTMQSSNDPKSFVLNNNLHGIKTWEPHSSVVVLAPCRSTLSWR